MGDTLSESLVSRRTICDSRNVKQCDRALFARYWIQWVICATPTSARGILYFTPLINARESIKTEGFRARILFLHFRTASSDSKSDSHRLQT